MKALHPNTMLFISLLQNPKIKAYVYKGHLSTITQKNVEFNSISYSRIFQTLAETLAAARMPFDFQVCKA